MNGFTVSTSGALGKIYDLSRVVILYSAFEEAEVQTGLVTCLKSQSMQMSETRCVTLWVKK